MTRFLLLPKPEVRAKQQHQQQKHQQQQQQQKRDIIEANANECAWNEPPTLQRRQHQQQQQQQEFFATSIASSKQQQQQQQQYHFRHHPIHHRRYPLWRLSPCLIVWSMVLWLSLLSQQSLAAPALGLDWFDWMDRNQDGKIDRSEYNAGVSHLEQLVEHDTPEWHEGLGANRTDTTTTTTTTATTAFSNWLSWSWWFGGDSGAKHRPLYKGGFWKAVTSSWSMIVATEIGDKTFFIAAVLSMRHNRSAVFAGALTALILMTILSAAMGMVLPALLPLQYTHILGGLLFGYFGIKLLSESRKMAPHRVSEELEQVEEELLHHNTGTGGGTVTLSSTILPLASKKKVDADEDHVSSNATSITTTRSNSLPIHDDNTMSTDDDRNTTATTTTSTDVETGHRFRGRSKKATTSTSNHHHHVMPPPPPVAVSASSSSSSSALSLAIIWQALTLTFVAEWGDRSQIATIALAAAQHPAGVVLGGICGHAFCTGLAVVGGRMLAARISEKLVAQYAGLLFLLFAVHSLFWETNTLPTVTTTTTTTTT